MNELESPTASGAAHGSAARCDWFTGQKRTELITCGRPIEWQHKSTKYHYGAWPLCDLHKRMLLESYCDEVRRKVEPEWERVVPPNTKRSHAGTGL